MNWGVFRGEHIIDLPEGLVGILGERRNSPSAVDSNGSGKSTFVNAIVAALFGPSGRSFADDVTRGEDRMEIELVFEEGDDVYRVRRSFTVKGGAKVDLEKADPDGIGAIINQRAWTPLTRESIDATQSLINRTIGLTRDTFLRSVFLSQEDGSFADGAAKEAKTLLSEAAFGLDPSWPKYAKRAADERKAFEVELQQIEGRTESARELVATKPEVEREHEQAVEQETMLADAVADREREHAALAVRYQEGREHAARRQAAEAELQTARAELERLQRLDVAATEAGLAIGQVEEGLKALPGAESIAELEGRERGLADAAAEQNRLRVEYAAAVQAALDATARRDALHAQADAKRSEVARVERRIAELEAAEALGTTEHCELCKQPLGIAALETTLSHLKNQSPLLSGEAARLDDEANAIELPTIPPEPDESAERPEVKLELVRGELARARSAAEQRARLEERITQLQATVDARPSQEALASATAAALEKGGALDALGAAGSLSEIEAQGRLAADRLAAAKTALEQTRQQRARLDERRVQVAAAEQTLTDAETRRAELHRAIDTRVRIEKACGLNGVPALILETAVIPFMEAQTADALEKLGTPWQVEIRTQREKQDGGLADTCEVVIVTDTGESPFRKLSGGEQMRVNIALRVALAKLLPGRSRLFVIDEPRWLDQAGVEALIDSLRGLLGEFTRIYCVTQSGTTLRDSFDTVLTIVKDGNVSRVDNGHPVEAEAVAA